MKKRGFTLIELLAVIVILGIVVVVTIPNIFKNVKESKTKAYNILVDVIKNAAQLYATKHKDEINIVIGTNNGYVVTVATLINEGLLEEPIIDPRNNAELDHDYAVTITRNIYGAFFYCYEDEICTSSDERLKPVITLIGNNPAFVAVGGTYNDAGATARDSIGRDITTNISTVSTVNVSAAGLYTVTYNVTDLARNIANTVIRVVYVGTPSDYLASEGVNRPKMAEGMTAIKWNTSTSTWDTIDNPYEDTTWYNYTNQQWANAKTADGSMWVWIPRYAYKITSGYHTANAGAISIKFLMDSTNTTSDSTVIATTPTYSGDAQTNFVWHPAFKFDTTELTGIWVAKFEASAREGVANGYTSDGSCPIGGDDVITKTINILPNAISWRCNSIGNMFTTARNMETNSSYGWEPTGAGIDTHLMKNTEWGAVAYLSKSTYGQNTNEVWINPANNYTTGCAGASASSAPTTGCTYAYDNQTYGVKASTTGTIYGVYDMSGGSWEYTSAYVNNANGNLSKGSTITGAASQYKDIYAVGGTDDQPTNYGLTISQRGDAIYETSNVSTGMPYTNYPWFVRGGHFDGGTSAGMLKFFYTNGAVGSHRGFRPVLIVNSSL